MKQSGMIDADELHVVFFKDFFNFAAVLRFDSELRLLAARYDLVAVARADAGIEAHGDAAAAVHAAVRFELRERIDAHRNVAVDAEAELILRDVVAYIENLVALKAGLLKQIYLAGRHRVRAVAFLADYLKK